MAQHIWYTTYNSIKIQYKGERYGEIINRKHHC
jgi:hypothetical protein